MVIDGRNIVVDHAQRNTKLKIGKKWLNFICMISCLNFFFSHDLIFTLEGINDGVTIDNVRNLMSEYGFLHHASCEDDTHTLLHLNGKTWCFVSFVHRSDAERARRELHSKFTSVGRVSVDWYNASSKSESRDKVISSSPATSLYVTFEKMEGEDEIIVRKEDLRDTFSPFGNIESIILKSHGKIDGSKVDEEGDYLLVPGGYAFVRFSESKDGGDPAREATRQVNNNVRGGVRYRVEISTSGRDKHSKQRMIKTQTQDLQFSHQPTINSVLYPPPTPSYIPVYIPPTHNGQVMYVPINPSMIHHSSQNMKQELSHNSYHDVNLPSTIHTPSSIHLHSTPIHTHENCYLYENRDESDPQYTSISPSTSTLSTNGSSSNLQPPPSPPSPLPSPTPTPSTSSHSENTPPINSYDEMEDDEVRGRRRVGGMNVKIASNDLTITHDESKRGDYGGDIQSKVSSFNPSYKEKGYIPYQNQNHSHERYGYNNSNTLPYPLSYHIPPRSINYGNGYIPPSSLPLPLPVHHHPTQRSSYPNLYHRLDSHPISLSQEGDSREG